MNQERNELPRRCQMQKCCIAENAIFNAMGEVEKMPADVILTNALNLLQQARDNVADYIDANPSYNIDKPKKKRLNRYNQFIIDNKGKLYDAFKNGLIEDGFKKDEGKRIVDLARVELGYSAKTWDGDIYMALFRNWKRIVLGNS